MAVPPAVCEDGAGLSNDVALVFLGAPIDRSIAQPVALADSPSPPSIGTAVVAMGYGSTVPYASSESSAVVEAEQAVSPVLLSVSLDVVAPFYCSCEGCIFDPTTQVCAGILQGGADSCQGDSGGPLMAKTPGGALGAQVGIISSGSGCGQPYSPASYTLVSAYLGCI